MVQEELDRVPYCIGTLLMQFLLGLYTTYYFTYGSAFVIKIEIT